DPARFVVSGRGQYEPAYSNDNESQRARNRRVEIIITREIADDALEEQ
ncbi:MAG: flagellar motor protein MotB, partial [Gammaproteobacteria bacterium]